MSERTTIGASEVAAILGLSPWQSQWNVWARLTGLVERDAGSNATRRGQILEPAIRQELARRKGVDITPGPAYEDDPWTAPDGWRHARPDGWYSLPTGERLVEIKSTRSFGDEWGADGSGGVPVHYVVQVVWQMAVAVSAGRPVEGVDVAAFATFTDELRVFRLPYDEARAERLVRAVAEWRERYVLTGEPPPIDGTEGCRAALASMYPADKATGITIEATDEDRRLAQEIAKAKAAIEAHERTIEIARGALCARMGLATEIRGVAKWSPVKGRRTLDTDALRAAHPDLVSEFTRVGESSRRFTLINPE